jgi:hypothetical protein
MNIKALLFVLLIIYIFYFESKILKWIINQQ